MSKIGDRINHLILPVFVLGIAGMASLMRLMRSQILEIKNSDFVRTARAKGLSERVVIYKHVLRNALNPFVTMAGYGLADLLGGAALVEAVMNLQGLGLLLLNAVRSLDIYLVMGSVLMGAVLLASSATCSPILRWSRSIRASTFPRWIRNERARRNSFPSLQDRRTDASYGGIISGVRREWRLASWPVRFLRALPAAVLSARDRVAGDRALRSDLPKSALARLPADGAAPQSRPRNGRTRSSTRIR